MNSIELYRERLYKFTLYLSQQPGAFIFFELTADR